jgi:hypothetical protein
MEYRRPRLTIVVKLTAPRRLSEKKKAPYPKSHGILSCRISVGTRRRNGREQDGRTFSGNQRARSALTTTKERQSVSGREEPF